MPVRDAAVYASALQVIAPFADTPIELSLLSVSAKRYKTYYCVECKHPFLQRDAETLYRLNTNDETSTVRLFDGMALAKCAGCSQKYVVTIALSNTSYIAVDNIQKELQSIYIVPVANKVSRYIRCMDCGYTFCSQTDRIARIVDNVVPLEYMPAHKVAYTEARCDMNRCRQRWAVVV
jgi:DNA-directed RNA polymerase subunit RPC12/RpoP